MIGANSAALALVWGLVYTAQGASEKVKFVPVPISRATSTCITNRGPVPSWNGTPHPDCQVSWAELGQSGSRTLYEARHLWPSPEFSRYKVVNVIVYERTKVTLSRPCCFSAKTRPTCSWRKCTSGQSRVSIFWK